MNRLSSNATLFWKIFVPVFYMSFVGLFILAVTVLNDELTTFSSIWIKLLMVIIYLIFITLMYFTIMDLKRVEATELDMYVSNYFKTYKYPKSAIENVSSKNFGIFNIITLTMKEKTSMGKKIRFIADKKVIAELL
jgi:hypothetical protein